MPDKKTSVNPEPNQKPKDTPPKKVAPGAPNSKSSPDGPDNK